VITNIEELNNQLQTVHAHVAEAIGYLPNTNGLVPDSWTLREQCYKAGKRLELFDELVAALKLAQPMIGNPDNVGRSMQASQAARSVLSKVDSLKEQA
jgi:hypothetical protein